MPLGEPTPLRVEKFDLGRFQGYYRAEGWPVDSEVALPDGVELWLARTQMDRGYQPIYHLVDRRSGLIIWVLGYVRWSTAELAMDKCRRFLQAMPADQVQALAERTAAAILRQRPWCIVEQAPGQWAAALQDESVMGGANIAYGPFPNKFLAEYHLRHLKELYQLRYTGETDVIVG